jgi:hypothetical protein
MICPGNLSPSTCSSWKRGAVLWRSTSPGDGLSCAITVSPINSPYENHIYLWWFIYIIIWTCLLVTIESLQRTYIGIRSNSLIGLIWNPRLFWGNRASVAKEKRHNNMQSAKFIKSSPSVSSVYSRNNPRAVTDIVSLILVKWKMQYLCFGCQLDHGFPEV